MGKLTCCCLNVKIHTRSLSAYAKEQIESENENEAELEDNFFSLQLLEAQLDLEGVRLEHKCLMKVKNDGDWSIYRCINCDMLTHAVCDTNNPNKILVNMSLKSDPTIIESLEQSPDFSKLYRIVLRSQEDNLSVKSLGLYPGKYDSVRSAIETIHHQLNKYLQFEKDAVEKRIKDAEEIERQKFADLKSKAHRDRDIIIYSIVASEKQEIDSNSVIMMQESPSTASPFSPNSLSGDDDDGESSSSLMNAYRKEFKNLKHPSSDNQKKKKSMTKNSNSRLKQNRVRHTDNGFDNDLVFDLDGIGDSGIEQRTSYETDDDADDTDDSDLEWKRANLSSRMTSLSTSAPINMPIWGRLPRENLPTEYEELDDETIPNHENIAASMKALARSVQTDARDLFGERPRPRINTLDIGHI